MHRASSKSAADPQRRKPAKGRRCKVVGARCRRLFFDEPTRGIDVAARRRIYRLFDALAADGKAVVIVSSDLEELLETCDRIAVMSAGPIGRDVCS